VRNVLPGAGVSAAAERLARLAAVLNAEPGLTSPEIAEKLGLSRRHASLLLLRLEELGHVVHVDRRWYAAPDLV
jgi:DNA-binding transcriptional regulator LsrR (DeoR family)